MIFHLLSAGESIENFIATISNFFNNFHVMYAMEIVLLFALIFFVSKVLRDNDATKLMLIYWLFIVMGCGMHIFDKTLMTKAVLLFFVMLLSTFMLILFATEVKRLFWDQQITEHSFEKVLGHTDTHYEEIEKSIEKIIKALQNMSKNNIGALIVLSKGAVPKQVLQSGTLIDAEISTQLIEGIFFPKAPLHDGAMIIDKHKIQAAGCFLPLTQKNSYPKEYGTRHRAGIGITEVANVMALIVSEETGIITIVKQDKILRYADYDLLMREMKEFYRTEIPIDSKKSWR